MTDDFSTRRRKLLQSAGAGGTALLAGCTEQLGLGQSSDGDREVGVVAAVDQQALQQAQIEAQQQAQQNNASEQEIQQDVQDSQREIISDATSALVDELESEGSLTIEQEYTTFGAVHVAGSASALIEALELETAQSLVSTAQLEGAASGTTNSS